MEKTNQTMTKIGDENPVNRISKEDFMAYEKVRMSGVTNMWAVQTVCGLSDLNQETVMEIMKNYSELADKFLEETN